VTYGDEAALCGLVARQRFAASAAGAVTLSDDDADEDDDEWQSVVLLLAVRFSMLLLLLLLRVKLTSPLIDYAANHTQTQRLDTTRYDKLSALKN